MGEWRRVEEEEEKVEVAVQGGGFKEKSWRRRMKEGKEEVAEEEGEKE